MCNATSVPPAYRRTLVGAFRAATAPDRAVAVMVTGKVVR